ncbi:MAG TPA: carboxylating nicotinate-nucleotide diphosphorylase [Cyclobacteriaceae bacterium]
MTKPFYLTEEIVSLFIESALAEDIGEGDHSSLGAVPKELISKAKLVIKADGVIAGLDLAEKIFKKFDNTLSVSFSKKDGDIIKSGEIGFVVEGSARSILTTERFVLNCMQRMSGIATYTHQLCSLIKDLPTQIMDTRKTTPNFRICEKWAVSIGGGQNHRYALYDMVMLKDNHIDMAGGIRNAIINTQAYLQSKNKKLKIEVETRSIEEVSEVLRVGGIDAIMLDNMSLAEMKKAVTLINGKYKTEASGGITEKTIRDVALCGVDFISVGALTHSVKSLDLSLKVFK